MTDVPPSRYKVVERDRRLVVIDTLTGKAASAPGPVPPAERQASATPPPDRPVTETEPRRIDDRSGAQILTTSPLYDLKAPRRIVMGDRFNEKIGQVVGGWLIALFVAFTIAFMFFPWLIVLPFVVILQPKLRATARQWVTARLDEVERS